MYIYIYIYIYVYTSYDTCHITYHMTPVCFARDADADS